MLQFGILFLALRVKIRNIIKKSAPESSDTCPITASCKMNNECKMLCVVAKQKEMMNLADQPECQNLHISSSVERYSRWKG